MDLLATIDLLRHGETFFTRQLASLTEPALRQPSALPGWSRAHLVGHVLRNVDGISNLLEWAITGVERPMYDDAVDRDTAIAALGAQSKEALRGDLERRSGQLVARIAEAPASSWAQEVRTARGRSIPASRLPWLRVREVWIHGVDLGAGATFNELPDALLQGLLEDAIAVLAQRDDCPAVDVITPASRQRIGVPHGDDTIRGELPEMVAWLYGRSDGSRLQLGRSRDKPPALPAWP